MGFVLEKDRFDRILQALGEKFQIYAPVRMVGKGRFSDTDLIRYGKISSINDIEIDQKSNFSPKEIIFPITQTLFQFTKTGYKEPVLDDKGILIFLRPCDINGIKRLDSIFLKNGNREDFYYKRLREKIKYVMIECKEGFENCFCVSMGTNRTGDYAMAVRFEEQQIKLTVKDKSLSEYFEKDCAAARFTPEFIKNNTQEVKVPNFDKISGPISEHELFKHELWEDYKSRCISCGRCNTTCITCSCFTASDLFFEDDPHMGERRRVWAGCHIDGFTNIAGGHSFRDDAGDRMRFKTLHKVYDFKRRFGENMCVGCGRCDDNCPEYISFANCINKVAELIDAKEECD